MKPGPPTKEIVIIITAKYSLNITGVVKLSNGQGLAITLSRKKEIHKRILVGISLEMWLRRRQRRYCEDNFKPGVREVGCEMVGNGFALCLMAGWGAKTSGFAVRYLHFYVEEMNIHSYVTPKRTVLPPKNMA